MTKGESLEGSTGFIVACRVKKTCYKDAEVKSKSHNNNAVMQDGAPQGFKMTLLMNNDVGLVNFFINMSWRAHKDVENREEVSWIIPDVGLVLTERPDRQRDPGLE